MHSSWSRWLNRVAAPARSPRRPDRRTPRLESLEDRVVPTITLPTPGTPGPVTITGPGNDQFVVRLQAGTPTNIQFSDNGGTSFQTAALADVTSVDVSSTPNSPTAGNDTLTIDESNGFVGVSGQLNLTFNSGPLANTIRVIGNPGDQAQSNFSAGATTGTGNLFLGRNTSTGFLGASLNFTQVSQIQDLMNGDLTVSGNANSSHVFELLNGPNLGTTGAPVLTGRLIQADRTDLNLAVDTLAGNNPADEANEAAPTLLFANDANVTINGGDGNDVFLLNLSTRPTGMFNPNNNANGVIAFDGRNGTNSLFFKATPPGVNFGIYNVQQVSGGTNGYFVQRLYADLLGRSATAGEEAFWTGFLSNADGRSTVVNGIGHSAEHYAYEVRTWYTHYLGRPAVKGEEGFWANMISQGMTEEQVLGLFLTTQEFFNHTQTLPGATGTANDKYIEGLYQLLLNRPAAQGELTFWEGILNGSGGRAAVTAGLVNSNEFRADEIRQYYAVLLHRTPSEAEVNNFVTSGVSLGDLRQFFVNSDEFFNG